MDSKNRRLNKKPFRVMAFVLAALLLLGAATFLLYVFLRTYPAESEALSAIRAEASLEIIEKSRYYILKPETTNRDKVPLIYYPGGLVSPEAYLYKMGKAAVELQKPVYLVKAPFNAAIFDTGAAGRIIDSYELRRAWIGGHSLGGISACRFAASNPDSVYGLFLFGSYCDQDLSAFDGPVVLLMGLNDEIINRENYREARTNLPPDTVILEVEGLNHSDFGNYGLQDGDGKSDFTDERVIELIVSLF